jgi:hypothetical protein
LRFVVDETEPGLRILVEVVQAVADRERAQAAESAVG